MSELEKLITSKETEAGDLFAKVKVVRTQDLRELAEQLESANSALLDEAKRHSEFMKGKVVFDVGAFAYLTEMARRAGADNRMEERILICAIEMSKALHQSTPTPLEQSGGKCPRCMGAIEHNAKQCDCCKWNLP